MARQKAANSERQRLGPDPLGKKLLGQSAGTGLLYGAGWSGCGGRSRWSAPLQDLAIRCRAPHRRLREALAGGPGVRASARCKFREFQALRAGGAHEESSGAGSSPRAGMGSTATITPRRQCGRRLGIRLGHGDQMAAQRSAVYSPSALTRLSGPPAGRTAAPILAWSTQTRPRGASGFRPTSGPYTKCSRLPSSTPATCGRTTGMALWWGAGRAAVVAINALGRWERQSWLSSDTDELRGFGRGYASRETMFLSKGWWMNRRPEVVSHVSIDALLRDACRAVVEEVRSASNSHCRTAHRPIVCSLTGTDSPWRCSKPSDSAPTPYLEGHENVG